MALVVGAHWQLAQYWPGALNLGVAPPARMAVELRQPMALKAPPTPPKSLAEAPRARRQLAAAPVPAAAASAVEPPKPLPELPALAELSPPPALPDPSEGEPGPEWPLSTRLRYSLVGHYRGAVHGDAEVEWLRQGRRYQVRLTVAVGPSLAPFITRRMLSEGELTPQGISPRRYDEETRVLVASPRRLQVLIDPLRIQFPNGRMEPTPPGVQDSASQFVQLTWLLLTGREPARAGHAIALPLALPRRLYAWRYDIVGLETLDTPLGPLPAWQLRPVVTDSRGTLQATVWLSPQLQYLPVRIRIVQDDETWVDLLLAEPPLQEAAPENAHPTERGNAP
ncbi:DUF3108 domain-containing protein [Inhella sp. 1Y17]|uniref:DUF3108 domain-containing protein n=1 Tax=Inhella proteolytica TaxID=2795029 RepID=A0A931NIH3_9BURK|nr:DUF3108 domain-containing protein [Inhella proteolytica]